LEPAGSFGADPSCIRFHRARRWLLRAILRQPDPLSLALRAGGAHEGAMSAPDFSSVAGQYARSRPGYPPELFAWLASLAPSRRLAWDCATGNGQAATSLVEWFDRVIATDVSAEQLRLARQHPRIDYRRAPAEACGLASQSVELITVASAVHWFDRKPFFAEAERVCVDRGVIAAWTYHVCHVEAPLTDLFGRLYSDVLAPYFGEGARLVDDHYESLELPGDHVESRAFQATATMNLEQMATFVESWSGSHKYLQQHGHSPLELIRTELEAIWGDPQNTLAVRWPLYLRVSRLRSGRT